MLASIAGCKPFCVLDTAQPFENAIRQGKQNMHHSRAWRSALALIWKTTHYCKDAVKHFSMSCEIHLLLQETSTILHLAWLSHIEESQYTKEQMATHPHWRWNKWHKTLWPSATIYKTACLKQ